jgi:molybdate transport system substrate-binding protein
MKTTIRMTLLFLLFAAILVAQPSAAAQVRVAAAADLKSAMNELSASFEESSGSKIEATFGSSGNFFSQMQNGAPFDVFLSADIDYPKKLEAVGLTEPGTLIPYAVGKIVIWLPPDTKFDVAKLGWNVLLDPSIKKISIANPDHAPYGRAAVAAMQKAGVYEQMKAKLVYGENISQAAQFVQSGNAQAGIVALSLAMSPAMRNGQFWQIPLAQYPPILQGAVVLRDAKNKAQAVAFLNYLKSDQARKILEKYGFSFPEPSSPSGKSE